MVVQKTTQFIEHMRGRSHDERHAFATFVAIGVVVVLFIGWGFLFLRKFATPEPVTATPETQDEVAAMNAAAFSALESAYASSTDGYVDLAPME